MLGSSSGKILLNHLKSTRKTPLPRMVVWDGDEEYYMVIGSESMNETDIGTQVSRFLEGYREGNVVKKSLAGPTLMGFLNSQIGVKIVLIFIFVALVMLMIFSMTKEEPLTVGTRSKSMNGAPPLSQNPQNCFVLLSRRIDFVLC
ncbi:UNVERIFIED_CONTAM: protein disulfide-isomerase 5-2 [Sesamum angustifolium]|uniref:Protein disulfide-isomerase 5-2 n=1 Tax=Sesamum angustifolium TaxID=2727405 RepID=A0AAW2L7U7_9LAMI